MNNNNNFIEKLRSAGLRPTKQRIKICKVLFDRNKTFHFTISDLKKLLKEKIHQKISLVSKFSEFWWEGFLRFLVFSGVFHCFF